MLLARVIHVKKHLLVQKVTKTCEGLAGMQIFFRFWFPVVLYSVIIFMVSSIEKVTVPLSGSQMDKVFHIIEYFPLGYLAARAFACTENVNKTQLFILLCSFGCSFIYACSDEWHQSFVIGRTASFLDVCADSIGALLGAYCFICLKKDVVINK